MSKEMTARRKYHCLQPNSTRRYSQKLPRLAKSMMFRSRVMSAKETIHSPESWWKRQEMNN